MDRIRGIRSFFEGFAVCGEAERDGMRTDVLVSLLDNEGGKL